MSDSGKKIEYDFEGFSHDMYVKSFAELEEIVREDTDLEPKDYIASFERNDKKYPIKNERHFA